MHLRLPHPALPCVFLSLLAGCATPSRDLPVAKLRRAPAIQFRGANSEQPGKPGVCDCNCPGHWDGDTLYVFNSAGHPWRLSGPDVAHLTAGYQRVSYDNEVSGGRWIECTWKADDGVLYGWYHWEPTGICPGLHPTKGMNYTAPKVGALRSPDNGASWQDLGIVLEASHDSSRCDTRNYYFVGGIGDFSVMLDPDRRYLYFFISTYPNNTGEQGVAVARMRWADRDRPVGKVWAWCAGQWREPGLGGHVTPIFPVEADWHEAKPDAFWGPSIHWNSHLQRYVILLNRARDEKWGQEGIYISYGTDLSRPDSWSEPRELLGAPEAVGWYPQVMGLEPGGTDKLAGRVARFFMSGKSDWEIEFER